MQTRPQLKSSAAPLLYAAVFTCNVVFYAGYDKAAKGLRVRSKLASIVSLRNGLRYTLDEINKVMALTGLTALSIAYVLRMLGSSDAAAGVATARSLERAAVGTLAIHGAYSGSRYWRRFASHPFGMGLGVAALGMAVLQNLGVSTRAAVQTSTIICSAALCTAALHFYVIERDAMGNMQVRPWGLVSLAASVPAAALTAAWCIVRQWRWLQQP